MRSFRDATRVLGALEERVMEAMWNGGPASVRELASRLPGSALAYTTVMTTLDRLFKKGLLTRERVGQAFVYRAALDRDGYRQRLIEAAVGELVDRAPDAVLAAFVDTAAALDEHNLLRLERLIAERKRKPK